MARKLRKVINGEPCELVRWTSSCTGCLDSSDGHPINAAAYDDVRMCWVGPGCSECGYTGKRRREEWVPINCYSDAQPTGTKGRG
jgi:hypothetical protein